MSKLRLVAGVLTVLAISCGANAVSAQPHPTMPVVVEADRTKIGPVEYLRRCDAADPLALIVPAGQTATAPVGNSLHSCVEVAGTLRFSRADDTTFRVTTIYMLPGGTLDMGTAADPIACNRHVEIVFSNLPIDPVKDPYQWGNGLVNFGTQTRVGCPKTAFLNATNSLPAGATTIEVERAPDNWAPGDELLIPDVNKPEIIGNGLNLTSVPSARETRVTIAAGYTGGTTIPLSKPLDFAHLNVIDLDGNAILRPRVANLTRNIVLRSENSANPTVGTRGHTADIGEASAWDVRFNQFVQLGRTANTPLDDAVTVNGVVTHIGTNQRGKYAAHFHHGGSKPNGKFIGNTLLGHPLTTKWGVAAHATHHALFQDLVVVDFPGAGVVTEDGYEVGNHFVHILSAYSMGIPGDALGTPDDVHIKNGCPGCSGAPFWFHGVNNYFERLEGWNSFRGIDLFNQSGTAGMYPSAPGVLPDTPFIPEVTSHQFVPQQFENNVAVGNTMTGLENWATHDFPNRNFIAAYNGVQIAGVLSDGIDHRHINPKLICKPGTGSTGIIAGQAYSQGFHIQGGGLISGCQIGIHGGGGSAGLFIDGPEQLVMQNEVDIDQVPHVMQLTNVLFKPLGNFPHQFITFGNIGRFSGTFWTKDEALPDVGDSDWRQQTGSQWKLTKHQGIEGNDYLLLHVQQQEAKDAWYSAPGPHGWNCPELGLTMGGCWDKYGVAWGGDRLKDADKVVLDGIVNAFGRRGFGVQFSPPRAVVTFPTMREPAIARGELNDLLVSFSALATGDLSTASEAFMIQVDGGPVINLRDYIAFTGSDRSFNAATGAAGVHTVKVWLTQKANPTQVLAGSEWSSQFCTGPSCQTTVPGTKNLTVAYAANAIASALLKVGATTQDFSDSVQVGYVMGTQPPAHTPLAQQATVDLIVSKGPSGTPVTTVPVPSVVGKTGSVADQTLRDVGLVVGRVDNVTNDAPSGTVISQTPSAGTVVNIGSGVDIQVSSGPPPPPTCVPPQIPDGHGGCVTPPPTTFVLTVVSGTGSGSYASGTVVPIVAAAAPTGQTFKAWAGATVANPAAASTTLTMPATATTVTATYAPVTTPTVTWKIYLGLVTSGGIRQKLINNVPTNEYRICRVPVPLAQSGTCDQLVVK